MAKRSLVPVERIEGAILVLRGHKVILDKNLAALYGVTTGNLNKAVNRNLERFPADFMLQLTEEEFGDLKFHFGTSRWGGTRKQSHGGPSASASRRAGPPTGGGDRKEQKPDLVVLQYGTQHPLSPGTRLHLAKRHQLRRAALPHYVRNLRPAPVTP
jgi:hypothetical protein